MAYQSNPQGKLWKTLLTSNDSTAQEEPGVIRELADGRKFRYIKMTGSALSLGLLVMPATKVSITNLTSATVGGTTVITDSDATWTVNAYVGWYYATLTAMTGSQEPIKIVGNTATTLTLEKQIATALTSAGTDDGEIIAGTAAGVLTAVTDVGQPVIGVGIGTITENYWGWVQIRGIGAVVGDSTAENESMCPGGNAVGQAIAADSDADNNIIGVCIGTAGTNEAQTVLLNIP